MRLSKRKHTTIFAVNMTPAIDMVFNLLIFFMTVSQVSHLQREAIQLPKVDTAEEQQPAELTVNVRQDGTMVVAGQVMTLTSVAKELANLIESRGGDVSQVHVVIRADERGSSRTVNDLVRLLNRLQIHAVRIAVQVQ
jgi:biopolymer transport protein ExbD